VNAETLTAGKTSHRILHILQKTIRTKTNGKDEETIREGNFSSTSKSVDTLKAFLSLYITQGQRSDSVNISYTVLSLIFSLPLLLFSSSSTLTLRLCYHSIS